MTCNSKKNGPHALDDVTSNICSALLSGTCCQELSHGRAVQIQPMKSVLKLPGAKRLKLEYDEPLSNLAFKSNLRRYTTVGTWACSPSCTRCCRRCAASARTPGRGMARKMLPPYTPYKPPLYPLYTPCIGRPLMTRFLSLLAT